MDEEVRAAAESRVMRDGRGGGGGGEGGEGGADVIGILAGQVEPARYLEDGLLSWSNQSVAVWNWSEGGVENGISLSQKVAAKGVGQYM